DGALQRRAGGHAAGGALRRRRRYRPPHRRRAKAAHHDRGAAPLRRHCPRHFRRCDDDDGNGCCGAFFKENYLVKVLKRLRHATAEFSEEPAYRATAAADEAYVEELLASALHAYRALVRAFKCPRHSELRLGVLQKQVPYICQLLVGVAKRRWRPLGPTPR